MAIKIRFDAAGNPQQLHLILATRTGRKIRELPIDHVKFSGELTNGSEISFQVSRTACVNKAKQIDEKFWRQITDLKLVYCPEIDLWYELSVSVDETNELLKNVIATSLGEAELSQINVYGIEVNTEADIEREDYAPTVLYDPENKATSLLDRLLYKAPHYRIKHVDASVAGIQRTFQFDGKSVHDAFQEISTELDVLFIYECRKTEHLGIDRAISVYDLESNCNSCGARGEFFGVCDKCGSTDLTPGYGEDTKIFVATENIATEINYETNLDEVKNCFRLEAGDDLMTATVMNCNPNGSQYLWYVPDWMKDDMSDSLKERLSEYDAEYAYYQNTYSFRPDATMRQKYNQLVSKYSTYKSDLSVMPEAITGFPSLMNAYYDTVDFQLLLDSGLMPITVISSTSAAEETAKLRSAVISPVAVASLASCTATTASSAVLGMAKFIVDARYQVKVKNSSYNASNHTWTGSFTVTSYSDEEDTADSASITVTINEDEQTYIKQKIDKMIKQTSSDATDISSLFELDLTSFKAELKKYSRQRLRAFRDACQAALDILIQQGVADKKSWVSEENDLYTNMYLPYYNKLGAIEAEIAVREDELAVVAGTFDDNGGVIADGMQTVIGNVRRTIQKELNFEDYLGEELWLEFASFRREDNYQNQNYISDGLDNAELFKRAIEFVNHAETDIYKSAMLQHTISASLHNLLIMPEFAPIVDYFELGNWIRIKSDGKIFRLRLAEYEIDYDSWNISVQFTDTREGYSVASDIESILSMARTMASSYGVVARQAEKGEDSKDVIEDWTRTGFELTTKIVGGAANQEFNMNESGFTGREYIPETDSYSKEQIKIISHGVYVTRDGWLTAEAGIGRFTYYDPSDKQIKDGFGVIADKIVGNVILSSEVGIYNEGNTVVMDKNGFALTTKASGNTTVFSVTRKNADNSETDILTLDASGQLVLGGNAIVGSLNASKVEVSNLNATNITTGTLSADRIAAHSLNVNKITGSLSGGLNSSWGINFQTGDLTIGNISAANITTGTLSADRIAAHSLNVNKITGSLSGGSGNSWGINFQTGTLTIGNINAANITAGTLNVDRIAARSISAGKIVSNDISTSETNNTINTSLGYADYSNGVWQGWNTPTYCQSANGSFTSLVVGGTQFVGRTFAFIDGNGNTRSFYGLMVASE